MADVTSANVTTVRTWFEWVNPFRRRTCKLVRVAITAAGTTSADALIPVSAFGMVEFEELGPMVKDDNTIVLQPAPSYARNLILIPAANSATATAHVTPTVITGTFQFIVKGR